MTSTETETATPLWITRDRYVELIRGLDLGIDPADLVSIHLGISEITAERYVRDKDGSITVAGRRAITQVIRIPITT